jgi:hypothetical protein
MKRAVTRQLHFGCGEALCSSLLGTLELFREARRTARTGKRPGTRKADRAHQ